MDANVLVESAVSDLYLRLSEKPALFRPFWSEGILAEAMRTFLDKLKWSPQIAERRLEVMQNEFPEAMVELLPT